MTIFLDANVFMLHVGRPHPLRDRARAFVARSLHRRDRLVTSAEVLQELLHCYLSTRRSEVLHDANSLVERCVRRVWPVERDDVDMARRLMNSHPGLKARDLVHLACCIRRNADHLMTFDRALEAAWRSRGGRRH